MKIISLIVVLFLIGACTDQNASTSKNVNSPVLARVGGSEITQAELDAALKKLTGSSMRGQSENNKEIQKNALESLVRSRAIALKMSESMTDEDLKKYDVLAKAYREELLVKAYLNKKITPKPVTNEMVVAYYQKHPEKFGGGIVREFEYVTVTNYLLETDDEEKVNGLIEPLKSSTLWAESVDALKSKHGLDFSYKKAKMDISLLKYPLKKLATEAIADNVVTYGKVAAGSKQNLILLRVLSESKLPPKPLAEVSAKIRKMLAPLQLKEAVREASDTALLGFEVERFNEK